MRTEVISERILPKKANEKVLRNSQWTECTARRSKWLEDLEKNVCESWAERDAQPGS